MANTPPRLRACLVAAMATSIAGCGGEPGPNAGTETDDTLVVFAVNAPLAYFADRIGGGDGGR